MTLPASLAGPNPCSRSPLRGTQKRVTTSNNSPLVGRPRSGISAVGARRLTRAGPALASPTHARLEGHDDGSKESDQLHLFRSSLSAFLGSDDVRFDEPVQTDRLSLRRLGRITPLAGQDSVGKTTVLGAVRAYATREGPRVLQDLPVGREAFGVTPTNADRKPPVLADLDSLFHPAVGHMVKKLTLYLVVFSLSSAANAQWKVGETEGWFGLGTTVSAYATDADGGGIAVVCHQAIGRRAAPAMLIVTRSDLGKPEGSAWVRWMVDTGTPHSDVWAISPRGDAAFTPKKRVVLRFIKEVTAASRDGIIKYEARRSDGGGRHRGRVPVGNAVEAIETAMTDC